LQERYPGLVIAGRANGYLGLDDMPELLRRINDSKAEILVIALGSPKQEKWFATYKDCLKHVRVAQGIGGTLDTIVGTVQRAPKIWRDYHAEWLYRLLKEPKRIKRQKVLPIFLLKVLEAKVASIFKGEEERT
jgi:N-acetylglucosaminyldiphosphoundecaprenol N-acetyl-beta-D-mannosaminyltransferase